MDGYTRDPITGVPILGTGPKQEGPNAPTMTINCEVYDTEIIDIQAVLEILNGRLFEGGFTLSEMTSEIQERFAKIGFLTHVNWYQPQEDAGFIVFPEITITDRTEKHEFDHDRQVHEVTHDVLDLGEGGVIKSNPADFEKKHGHQH